ncbi:UNVERIFIED_CONTAM: hypothetical protein GTU68_056365 [Idotea baltica]|nr:hypothetical protein [Idotea baltica]
MAGGTGGHVFPALTCAKEFQARGLNVHWLGTSRGIENELVPAASFPLHLIKVTGLRGKGLLSLVKAPFQLLRATYHAYKIIREIRPCCVLGMGGYVTGPGGLAAKLAGIPLIIHEQNAVVGTSNKMLSPCARYICSAFPNTFVESEFFSIAPLSAEMITRKIRVLVVGGSLGAEPLNKLLPEALALIAEDIRPMVTHQTGSVHINSTIERYSEAQVKVTATPFIDNMSDAYAKADLVICRSGALTVSELAAAGRPSFLIPLPHAIDDHQTRNAQYLSQLDAAVLLPQSTTNAAELAKQLTIILTHKSCLIEMGLSANKLSKPDATLDVVNACMEVSQHA